RRFSEGGRLSSIAREAGDRHGRPSAGSVRGAHARRPPRAGVQREAAGLGGLDQRRLLPVRARWARTAFRVGPPDAREPGAAGASARRPTDGVLPRGLLVLHRHAARLHAALRDVGERPCAMGGMAGEREALTTAYAGRRVLLTGHTGFKGGWLATWL